ncbi:MAG: TIGR02679 family protein [Solirubrobacterales bacterium]
MGVSLSGSTDVERLGRLLGDPELEWLLARVRRRLELDQPLEGTVTLADASAAQRRAVQRLLGRRPRAGRALSVSLGAVDELVRRSRASPDGLAAAVVALTGPVVVHAEASAAERLAWERAFAPLEDLVDRRVQAKIDRCEELASWLARLRRSGVVKRLEPDPAEARTLLEYLATVLAALPAGGEPLGSFAARLVGGAHALDDGEPLATLALGAARALGGLQDPDPDESPAESRREAWAAAGLLCDELSSVVLTLGLPGDKETGSGRILQVARETGQPVWLTLRQLVRDPPGWMTARGVPSERTTSSGSLSERTVHICENPVIVALAGDRLGAECPPLVCTSGQPGAATMLLLRALAAAGARLTHHGDFDWGGVRIANVLHARLPLVPWRFDTEAYLRAADTVTSPQPLVGAPAPASWDPRLGETMRRVGRRIEEELVLEELLGDLAGSPVPRGRASP